LPARRPSVSSPSSARGDGSRDQEDNRPPSVQSSDATRGLGIDPGAETPAPGKEAMAKLNQIIAVSIWQIYGICALTVLILTRGSAELSH
jgi:autophagy-related protein 13